MKKITRLCFCLFVALFLMGASNLRSAYEAPYHGHVLQDAFSKEILFICISNLAGNTGFYGGKRGSQLVSEFARQKSLTTWVIKISGKAAYSSNGKGRREGFVVKKFEPSGIILVAPRKGKSTSMITIDPANSSFVYTSQNVSEFLNRVSTFVGKCVARSDKK